MTEWNPDNAADLGIWEDLSWTQPPPAKKCLSLKLKKRSESFVPDRFVSSEKSLAK